MGIDIRELDVYERANLKKRKTNEKLKEVKNFDEEELKKITSKLEPIRKEFNELKITEKEKMFHQNENLK